MIKYYLMLIIVVFTLSCKQKTERILMLSNETNAVGDISKDSIYNGIIKFYDNITEKLIEQTDFNNGIRNGMSYHFYYNGKIRDKSQYVKGKLDGYVYFYDSTGLLTDIEHYYAGIKIGAKIHYINNKLNYYQFNNLEDETILSIEYDSLKKKKLIDLYYPLIFSRCKGDTVNDTVHLPKIFIYLPNPPKFKFEYSIVKVDKECKNPLLLHSFNKDTSGWACVYFEEFMNRHYIIPKQDSLAIRLKLYDSLNNDHWTVYRKLF